MKRLIIATMAIVAICSCAKSEQSAAEEQSTLAASFSSSITRVVNDTSWESTDEVGILVLDEAGEVSETHPFNARHTVSTAGAFSPYDAANTIYYSTDEAEKVNFYAYYPYHSSIYSFEMELIINAAIPHDDDIDFMEAYTTVGHNCKSGTVPLTFTRRLSKITLNLIAKDGFDLFYINQIALEGVYSSAAYCLDTRSFELSTKETIYFSYASDSCYSAVMIPMVDGEDELYELTEDSKVVFNTDIGDVVWELYDTENDTPYDIAFKAGSEHTFNLTISREDFTSAGKIEGWTEVTGGDFTTDNN